MTSDNIDDMKDHVLKLQLTGDCWQSIRDEVAQAMKGLVPSCVACGKAGDGFTSCCDACIMCRRGYAHLCHGVLIKDLLLDKAVELSTGGETNENIQYRVHKYYYTVLQPTWFLFTLQKPLPSCMQTHLENMFPVSGNGYYGTRKSPGEAAYLEQRMYDDFHVYGDCQKNYHHGRVLNSSSSEMDDTDYETIKELGNWKSYN